MSYYYTYYIGYKDGDDKISLLGPFDNKGNLKDVLCVSRSFIDDLDEYFADVGATVFTTEDRARLHLDDDGFARISCATLDELPSGDYIKRGYFLIDDVKYYLDYGDNSDIFYDSMSPEIYAAAAANELKFGYHPKKDEEGNIFSHSCADYMYFCYADYASKEYYSSILRNAACRFTKYNEEDPKAVIVCVEG